MSSSERPARKRGSGGEEIYEVTAVGNTCMQHLFLGLDPVKIALSPYVPALSAGLTVDCRELGINIHPRGKLYFLPSIAGFVGSDTVAVILATGMQKSPKIQLALDLGTNGEMVLGTQQKLVACSTAAGPAFEGAKIRYGMRGATGAIQAFKIAGGGLKLDVIGGSKPRGICGSGLIDIVAELLRLKIIDNTGRIRKREDLAGELTGSLSGLLDRVMEVEGMRAFILATASESATGEPVFLTQRDIRELQLAKGAVAAGIQIMLAELGLKTDDVETIFLAGAFGIISARRAPSPLACCLDLPGIGLFKWATRPAPAPRWRCSPRPKDRKPSQSPGT